MKKEDLLRILMSLSDADVRELLIVKGHGVSESQKINESILISCSEKIAIEIEMQLDEAIDEDIAYQCRQRRYLEEDLESEGNGLPVHRCIEPYQKQEAQLDVYTNGEPKW